MLVQEEELFSHVDGFPRKPFPHSWRGKNGLYAAGFTKKGLMGTSYDALRIAGDIADQWTETFACPTASLLPTEAVTTVLDESVRASHL